MTLAGELRVLFCPAEPVGLVAVLPYSGRGFDASRLRDLVPAEELAPMDEMSPSRAREYLAGRAAASLAMARLGLEAPALMRADGGRPVFPDGISGSISHSQGLAAALVAEGASGPVGLDLQWCDAAALQGAVGRILAPGESPGDLDVCAPSSLDPITADLAVRFSVKEAAYKCLSAASPSPSWISVLDFSDMRLAADGSQGRGRCLALRSLKNWPNLSAAWTWLSLGAHGPRLWLGDETLGPSDSSLGTWVLAWVWQA